MTMTGNSVITLCFCSKSQGRYAAQNGTDGFRWKCGMHTSYMDSMVVCTVAGTLDKHVALLGCRIGTMMDKELYKLEMTTS